MDDEGPSLRIDSFAVEVESNVPKPERRQTLMDQAKDIRVGLACFRHHWPMAKTCWNVP